MELCLTVIQCEDLGDEIGGLFQDCLDVTILLDAEGRCANRCTQVSLQTLSRECESPLLDSLYEVLVGRQEGQESSLFAPLCWSPI